MSSPKLNLPDKSALPFKTSNKLRRQSLHIKQKRARDSFRRVERFGRKKEEAKNPKLRDERLRRNVPLTLDRKRVWDEVDGDLEAGGLGVSVDVEVLKRRKLQEEQALPEDDDSKFQEDDEDDDSMLEDEVPSEDDPDEGDTQDTALPSKSTRQPSPTRSTTSTNLTLNLAPESLVAKFPTLFPSPDTTPPIPKILITTSLNSTLHHEAHLLTTLFPHSTYIRRTSHRYAYKFSLREISSFASSRNYTAVLVLSETMKRPTDLTIIHLPSGPTMHFTLSSFVMPRNLPDQHGNPTSHIPELILNNFTTPLGLLTAHSFRALFPPQPDLQGRQVVTLHNQRDFIFLRRHRYVFRDRRESEKKVVDGMGREMKGAEGIRTGLQELGPRVTLKLRRVVNGIQKGSAEWTWKGKTDRIRTKFQL